MPETVQHVEYDHQRITRLLIATGLSADSAARLAATFATGVGQTLEQLFGGDDFLLDTRGAIVLSVLGAILLRRAGADPLTLAPEIARVAEQWDDILGEGLYGPFFVARVGSAPQ